MGLDMYLRARKSFYKFYGDNDVEALRVLNENPLFVLPGAGGNLGGPKEATFAVEVEAMYWRKANHIHLWFVQNVQGGNDDCGTYDVSVEQITALRNLCKRVMDDHSLAPTLLTTQSGFSFSFGSTDYDDGYFQDCEETYNTLSAILKNPEKDLSRWGFTYHSLW